MMIRDFRQFVQGGLATFLPKIKRRKRIKIEPGEMSIKPDEYLTTRGEPFRFSEEGAKRPIEKRKR